MKTYEEEEHNLSVERGVTSIVTMEDFPIDKNS